jgi:hypothetical protein
LPAPAFVGQGVNDKARSDRYRKRGHSGRSASKFLTGCCRGVTQRRRGKPEKTRQAIDAYLKAASSAGTSIMPREFPRQMFVFKPSLRLACDVTVRTLDDAAEFARTYVGPRLPHRRDRVVHRLEEISDEASARVAVRAFRAWVIAEGLLAEES